MTMLQLIVIAVVQGITEFLPISSSGHLALTGQVCDWPDQGILMDAGVHVGTLLAVVLYCHRDLFTMTGGLYQLSRGRMTDGGRMLIHLVIGTIPLVIFGFLLVKFDLVDTFRTIEVIGWTTLGFGVLLYIADRVGITVKRVEHMRFGGAIVIGLFQALALIPGTSRSGITMTAARMLGYERHDSARFSMLLSIPAILAAGTLTGMELLEQGNAQFTNDVLIAGGLAFATALVAIIAMMAWLKVASYTPFVIYRLILGVLLLGWAYGAWSLSGMC